MKIFFYIVNLLLITAIICSITSCSNHDPLKGNGKLLTKDVQVGEFSKLEIEGFFKVILTQGETPKLSIEADENLIEYINVKVSNKKLKIRSKKNIRGSKDISIYLTFNSLDQIMVSGYTSVSSAADLNFDKLNLELSGNCKLDMNLNCVGLNAEISGNSNAALSGAVLTANFDVSGASKVEAFELYIDDLKLNASGNASARVNIINKFDVNVSGAAGVEYQGTPEMKQETSGTATVTKIY
ncbi:MAG TPA: head GIN domain-containing protein [Bacteroidales bacterium]|nr:head GIN domain-containing protein [Bacteroidales bacterium]